MVINNSRIQQFNACRQKAYNKEELNLEPDYPASPLLVGGGFHAGIAVINVKKAVDKAIDACEAEMRKRLGGEEGWQKMLPEQRAMYEKDIDLAKSMTRVYGEQYVEENFQMLAPEVDFLVPLPQTEHHCFYAHRFLTNLLAKPNADELFRKALEHRNPHTVISADKVWSLMDSLDKCDDPSNMPCTCSLCSIPHHLAGTTDAVITMNKVIWLMEHKTTAYDLYNNSKQSKDYIANWMLSTQATTYIYGIWKSTGVRPHGVLLNVVIKPRANAANPTFNFYREGFLRTEASLKRFETEVIRQANAYENAMQHKHIWMNPNACFDYRRRCEFHKSCVEGEEPNPNHFRQRDPDYVQLNYYKLYGLEPPKEIEDDERIEGSAG